VSTNANPKPDDVVPVNEGAEALHLWFGLSYAAWLTLPRVMMRSMPDDWQRDMARLLNEWDQVWQGEPAQILAETRVQRVGERGRLVAWPEWVKNYRRPDEGALDEARGGPPLITLEFGDPRHAAWLQHWRNTGEDEAARATEREKLPIDVESDWPPESASVEHIDYGGGRESWIIPPETPEWASHVAVRFREAPHRYHSLWRHYFLDPKQLTTRTRWGEF